MENLGAPNPNTKEVGSLYSSIKEGFLAIKKSPEAAKGQIARILDILGRRRTRKLPSQVINLNANFSERAEAVDTQNADDINRAQFEDLVENNQLYEIPADKPFLDIVDRIDQILTRGKPNLEAGQRVDIVHVGKYFPPLPQNVPELMKAWSNKADILWNQTAAKPNTKEREQFVAWATWVLINIHPKLDGNGRLSKAVASYLLRDRRVLGWRSDLWNSVFLITDREMMKNVAARSQTIVPEVPNYPVDENLARQWVSEYGPLLHRFYYPNGQDLVAGILREAIDNTYIDKMGKFHFAGLSAQALDLMTTFLAKAPKRT